MPITVGELIARLEAFDRNLPVRIKGASTHDDIPFSAHDVHLLRQAVVDGNAPLVESPVTERPRPQFSLRDAWVRIG